MNPLVEKISKLPKQQKLFILLGVVAVIAAGFYFGLFARYQNDYTTLRDQLTKLQDEIKKDRDIANNLPRLKAEHDRLNKELKEALTELPDQKEIPSLLTSISRAGKGAGLDFLVFRPKGEIAKDFYFEIPVDISVSGDYYSLADFFIAVGNLPRIINITNLSFSDIKSEPGGRTTFKVNCLATTFRFMEKKEKK
jgi:type IV pilus assembly protein PilO